MTFDIKKLEDCLAEITHNGKDLYPKELGNGLWQISDNTITNEKGMESFNEQLKNEIEKYDIR
jgi:hypothetical protein